MSALAFFASIVRSLAWPAAVVIIACVFFRKQIREVIRKIADLIPYLRSVKAGGTELTFDSDQLAAARTDMAKIYAAGPAATLRVTAGRDLRLGSRDLYSLLRVPAVGVTGGARPAGEAAALTSKCELSPRVGRMTPTCAAAHGPRDAAGRLNRSSAH